MAKTLSRVVVRLGNVASPSLFLTLRTERVEFQLGMQLKSVKQYIKTENDGAIVLRSRATMWGIPGQGRRFRLRSLVSIEVFPPFLDH